MNYPDIYIFQGLNEQEVQYFLLMSEPMEFSSGDTIIHEGEAADGRAYIIESGQARITKNKKPLSILESGSLFGEIALITNDPRTATVEAVSKLKVLAFSRDDFLLLLKKSKNYDAVKKEIFRRIQENFTASTLGD